MFTSFFLNRAPTFSVNLALLLFDNLSLSALTMTKISKEDRHKIRLLYLRTQGFSQRQRRMVEDMFSVSYGYLSNFLYRSKLLTGRETFKRDEIFSQELDLLFPFRSTSGKQGRVRAAAVHIFTLAPIQGFGFIRAIVHNGVERLQMH